jgi:inhibitor of KinA
MSGFRIVDAGDAVLVVEFDDRIDVAVNARTIALADAVRSEAIAGVRDVVPTFRSVAVYFDPLRTDRDRLRTLLQKAASQVLTGDGRVQSGRVVDIPVCYDAEFALDLDAVASRVGLDPETVVQLHAGRTYRVFMLGFVPGFAYLGMLDARIAVPRRDTPRPFVEPGSVAIAGEQTGVYPARTPGGWHIIGRTPLTMFSPDRPASSLLRAGENVRFSPLDRDEFARRLAAQDAAA